MATIDLTQTNLDQTIKNNDFLLIDFWATWCAPCRQFKPIFEKSATKHSDMAFAKVNTEEQRELAGMFGIRSIPTLAIFREGILVFMQPGALPAPALEEVITKVKALDMDDVRKKLEEEEKKLASEKSTAGAAQA